MQHNRGVIVSFTIMILFMALLGAFAVHSIKSQEQVTENIYHHPFSMSIAVGDINTLLSRMQRDLLIIATSGSTAEIRQLRDQLDRDQQQMQSLFDLVLERALGDQEQIRQARQTYLSWKPLRDRLIALAGQPHSETDIAGAMQENTHYVQQLNVQMQALTDYAANQADTFHRGSKEDSDQALLLINLLLAGIILVSMAIAIYVVASLSRSQRETLKHLKAVAESENKYRELLDAAPDGIVIVGRDRRIRMVNRQATRMFGYEPGELLEQSIDRLVPTDYRERNGEQPQQYLEMPNAHGIRQGRRLDGCRKDGSLFPVSIGLSRVTLGGDMLVTVVIRDLTDELKLEMKFRESQKMQAIGTLVGGIAHDFNNILASIIGNVYLAGTDSPEAVAEKLQVIEKQAERAAGIVQQLLSFSRQGFLRLQQVPLAPLVRQKVEETRKLLPSRYRFNVDIAAGDVATEGDPDLLGQIVSGLVSNAVDAVANHPEPVITISLNRANMDRKLKLRYPEATQSAYACLTVTDNGTGIAEKDLPHIFDPFYTTKEVGKGSGLGLSMILGAIQSHHGMIDVESRAGTGSTFRIYLPLANVGAEKRPPLPQSTGPATSKRHQTVLVADDETALCDVMRRSLELQEFEVIATDNGLDAVETFLADPKQVDLVVLDVLMPRLDGVAAAQRIREIRPDVPVIFITGYDREVIRKHSADELDRSAIITKPFGMEELLQAVDRLLQKESESEA
ncbi:MAG TPA: PAS domain S-box protein [Mariprofundaceae bacterium]|nr:PAS domain S-box protein [Mariprofundaceae bacterium]